MISDGIPSEHPFSRIGRALALIAIGACITIFVAVSLWIWG